MGVVVNRPGEGERHEMGPNAIVLHAVSEDTAGTFFMSESTLAPGFPGPPLHVHEQIHDMFFVLEGTLSFELDGTRVEAGPGTFVCVPPGTPHRFSNESGAPVRFLNLNTPGGFEGYMRELAAAAAAAGAEGRAMDPSEIGKIASKYDFRPA